MKKFDFSKYRTQMFLAGLFVVGVAASIMLVYIQKNSDNAGRVQQIDVPTEEVSVPKEPKLEASELLTGLQNPWDVAFLPDKTLLFSERSGQLSMLKDGSKTVIADITDVYSSGEGGLTGLALDTDFAENRLLYTCFNAQTAGGLDVRLVRWKLSEDNTKLLERNDIVTGIPSNSSGRHSGCRVKTDSSGSIWVGTGDAAKASVPQDPKSLGGKILHVTRDGMPAGDNLPAPFDPRIFSYGHRNVQGIALFEDPIDDVYGYSIEHGSSRDDEVNLIRLGNFGWAPKVTYIEAGIPMTDTARFPDAIGAIWNSGVPTIAPSGATILQHKNWGTWQGSLAMAVLKDKHLRILRFDSQYKLVDEKKLFSGEFGRIRSATEDGDGNLYLTTDNSSNDKIIKITPMQ